MMSSGFRARWSRATRWRSRWCGRSRPERGATRCSGTGRICRVRCPSS